MPRLECILQRHRAFVVAVMCDPHEEWSHPDRFLQYAVAGHKLTMHELS